ncbi:MAG: type II secretion system protein GspM [Kofleriaceae bacterium]
MAIRERARDFWDRISPRERMLVILASIAAPLILTYWLGSSISDGLGKIEAKNEKMRKALRIIADVKARGPVQASDDTIDKMGTELLPLESYVQEAAAKSKIVIKSIQSPPEATKNKFVTKSVKFKLEDLELDQLKSFLQEIETKSKVVVVTDLDVARDFKDPKKVDADLEISTYAKAKEVAATGSAGSAKKAGP